MLGMHFGRVPRPSAAEDEAAEKNLPYPQRDTDDWLQLINRASIVSNIEAGLLDRENGRRLAQALDIMREEAKQPGAKRAELYITFEPEMLKRAGLAASIVHVGRSSQDILATANLGLNLERLNKLLFALTEVRRALLELARREEGALVPSYTNGVQAQPTLYSHYLLAQDAIFARDFERVLQCIDRYDTCPMGSGVCNGTGWPLPTARMAELLGFKRTFVNAFDAGQCQGNDVPLEISQIISSAMLHVNAFLADFMIQYATPRPWIHLTGTNGVYRSSAMPQKRNPGLINDCRRDAGLVLGEAAGVAVRVQNLSLGMADVRDVHCMQALCDDACVTLRTFAGIVGRLAVDRVRSLEELNADWTCTQEIADQLVRLCGVDFRTGHSFASHLVTWARAKGVTPPALAYEDAAAVWRDFRQDPKFSSAPAELPMTPEALRRALDPQGIVEERATPGSANPAFVKAMLADAFQALEADEQAAQSLVKARAEAASKLDEALAAAVA